MITGEDLGPLPKGDRNDELQQESLAAFRALLPNDRFLPRDERVDDKGVDMSLELKSQGSFTNVRAQLQIKATESTAPNADGSYSRSVDVSNLNYLLNGPSPIYVLWIAPVREFRYVWARDEARRLHLENPEWSKQETVTLRFRERLDEPAWDCIFDGILKEGRLHRRTHDSLARVVSACPLSLQVDPTTLQVTTGLEAYQAIREAGLALVSGGYGALVLDRAKLLSPSERNQTHIRLVCGYAALSLGDYFSARADLGRVSSERQELNAIDQYFLDAVMLECDYKLGRLSDQQYAVQRAKLESSAPLPIALQLRLERIRREHLSATDPAARRHHRAELEQVANEIEADSTLSESLRLEAKLYRLFAKAMESDAEYIHALTRLVMRREMGHHPLSPGVIGDLQTQFQELLSLDKEVVACVEEAVRLKHPLLLAESLLAKAMIFLVRTVNTRLVLSKPGEQLPPVSHQTTDQMIMELQQAEGYFRQAEHTEGVVRTVLLQADWLEAMGSSQEAVKVAVSVEGIAIAMGYTDQIRRIEDHRSGITEYRRITDRITSAEQPDNMIALASDAELHRFAHDCLQSLELPLDRLPVIERECESMRCIAVEQRTWCRHLELFQDLRHTQSPRTHYLRDPDRSCYCKFRKIHGLLQTPDWSAVIAAFKRNYCADCSDRSPETASSPT